MNNLNFSLILLLVFILPNQVLCQSLSNGYCSPIYNIDFNLLKSEKPCTENMQRNIRNPYKNKTHQLLTPNFKFKDTQLNKSRTQMLSIHKHTIGYSTLNNSSLFYGMSILYHNHGGYKPFLKLSEKDFFESIIFINDIGGELIFSNNSKVNFAIHNSFIFSFNTKFTENAFFLPVLGADIHYSPFAGKHEYTILPKTGVSLGTAIDLTYGYSINRTNLFEGYNKHNISLKFRIGTILSAFDKNPKNYLKQK